MRKLILRRLGLPVAGGDGYRLITVDDVVDISHAGEALSSGRPQAQTILEREGGHVLIWGQVLGIDERWPALYLTSSATLNRPGQTSHEYRLDDAAMPIELGAHVGDVLRLAIVAQASAYDASRYVVAQLEPELARLQRLIFDRTRWEQDQELQWTPAFGGWSSAARVEVLGVYINALLTYGDQAGTTPPLRLAIALCRRALDDTPRQKVPLPWAATQLRLGNALLSVGKREPGTARLQQAVEAYQQALREFTRERVPLQWAMTQNNLGNALRSLNQRSQQVPCAAVVAHAAALEVVSDPAEHYARIAASGLREDLAASPAPSAARCPDVPSWVWEVRERF